MRSLRTAQALYDAVVARYSSPATAALGRLLLPYLFPKLSAFATVKDLVSHLRASDARYRAAAPADFHDRNQPPMMSGLLLLVQKGKGGRGGRGGGGGSGSGGGGSSGGSGVSGGSGSCGSGGGSGGLGGGGGGSGGSGGSGSGGSGGGRAEAQRGGSRGGQRQRQQRRSETPSPQQLREWLFQRGASGGSVSCSYVIRTGDRAGQTCGKPHTQHRYFSRLDDAWRAEFRDEVECPRWAELLRSGVAIFDLDYDANLSAMYALSASAEGDCYRCVPPDPGIEAAALGASEASLPGTALTEALHTFTLDSSASRCFFHNSTTLTPLLAPVPVRLADPSGGPVVARSSTVLPCLAVLSASLSDLHLPSFSTNLVSTAALQDAMVTTTTPGGQRVAICTCARTGRHLATFTRWPGSSLYTLATGPPHIAASAQVSASGPVAAPARVASCRTRLSCGTTDLVTPPCHAFMACTPASLSLVFPGLCLPSRPLLARPAFLASRGARVSGQGRERYFLLVIDDYTRYTTVFPLRSKGQIVDVLIPWIRTVRLQLGERFGQDLPVLRLHSDKGGEFSSDLLRDFCQGEGILQSFTLLASPHENRIAERRIGLVMEVAPQPVALCLLAGDLAHTALDGGGWRCVAVPDLGLSCLCSDKLSTHAIPCVFLGFPPDAPGWQFYHPTSSRVFPSQDVMFDESVPFYRLFPYRSAPPPHPLLFLTPGPPLVDPLPPQGPAPSGVSQVDPLPGTLPVEVASDSGAARGVASGGAEPGGAELGGVEPGGVEPGGTESQGAESWGDELGGAEPEGIERGGAESEGAESGGAESRGAASSGGPTASGAGGTGDTKAGGAGVTAGAGVTGGTAAAGPGGARTTETGAAGTGGVGGAGTGDPTEPGAAGAGGAGAGGTGAGAGGAGARGTGAGGAGGGGAGAGGTCAGGVGAGGVGAVGPGAGGAGAGGAGGTSAGGTSQLPLQPASPLPAPSPYTEQFGGLTKRSELASRPVSPFCTTRRIPHLRPPPVPGTHAMALRPSSVPLRVPLSPPPESSLLAVSVPGSDLVCAANPTVSRLLATVVTDPSFESTAASALVAELLDFATVCRLDYATALEDFECLAVAVPRFSSMLLAPEGDPDAPDIPTPRSYAEAITGPYSSQWQAAMDAEMASWKSTGTYVDAVPPSRANIVDGMWVFRVKRPPGSPPAFKACYVARGFSERQGVDYFHTFSPTPKMTTLRMLLHVAAQRDYELHSFDFSTAFL
ncbi:unnamed protein product [Closterium sp. NIES-53]